MGKTGTFYICSSCGFQSIKWLGKCNQCSSWNSFQESKTEEEQKANYPLPLPIQQVKEEDLIRYVTQSPELDRVLGGGIVPGSVILIGGDPGIGKSTLLLQISSFLAQNSGKILYLSGEESRGQIRLRAQRLGALNHHLYLVSTTHLQEILSGMKTQDFILMVVDSIQAIQDKEIASLPGSVRQVQEVASQLITRAKEENISLVLIGHVTKEGLLAGPKVLEHLVDVVLYLEGEHQRSYRILRGMKNRYGTTSEMGVFSMTSSGLVDVANPSRLFIDERPTEVSGSIIIPCMEGSRPFLVEVQALVTPANFGNPRRMAAGVDYNRVILLLAVLEKHMGLVFSDQDVHLNLPGGLRVDDVALDLGILLAITSSYYAHPLAPNMAVFGEVGLAGEIRTVVDTQRRIKEAVKLGFTRLMFPQKNIESLPSQNGVEFLSVRTISEVHDLLFVR